MGIAHKLLAGDDGAVTGNAQVAHAVHLLAQGFLAEQGAITLHQHQAGFHRVEVHLPAFGFGTNSAVGHHQCFTVRHPRHLMRADAVGGDFAAVNQTLALKAINPQQATARIGGVVFSGVQPLAIFMDHGVTIKMPVGQGGQGLQQLPVGQADQVAFGTGAPGHEQGDGQRRVVDDVMAALADPGAEHPGAIESIADGKVIAVCIVAGTQQQRALAFLFKQRPTAQRDCTEQ